MATEANTSSSLFTSLYKSRHILLSLLYAQGYDTSSYEGFSKTELHSMCQHKQLDMFFDKNDKKDEKIYIKYYNIQAKSLRAPAILTMIGELYETDEFLRPQDTLFIISNDEPSNLITFLKDLWEQRKLNVVIMNIKHLQFNILEHSMVPKHEILTETEKEEFMKTYHISALRQVPEISRFDPVSRVIGLRPGQVCKITRSSKTAITAPYYRACVNI